jgi:hypothetical protein
LCEYRFGGADRYNTCNRDGAERVDADQGGGRQAARDEFSDGAFGHEMDAPQGDKNKPPGTLSDL